MEVPVEYIPLRNFLEWFENMLNNKYETSLQGLKLRFLTFFNILNGILLYILDLNKLVDF
jgi:hypothetical protein